MRFNYFQSQIKVAAIIRKGVSFSSIGDKYLDSELYFLYMFIRLLIINNINIYY